MHVVVNRGEGEVPRCLGKGRVPRGEGLPLRDEKPVGGDAEAGVVVEASPSPPFIGAQAKLLLELAIIPLDAPAELGRGHEIAPRRVRRKRGQPVFERLGIAFGPLDQQPFLGARPGRL